MERDWSGFPAREWAYGVSTMSSFRRATTKNARLSFCGTRLNYHKGEHRVFDTTRSTASRIICRSFAPRESMWLVVVEARPSARIAHCCG
jgi:hypothetical protein